MITGSVPVGRYSQQSILNLTQEDNIHGGTSFTLYGIQLKAKLTRIYSVKPTYFKIPQRFNVIIIINNY